MPPSITERELPPSIEQRLRIYSSVKSLCWSLHWTLGGIAILAAAIAATKVPDPWRSISAVIATLCVGLTGFIHPREQYDRFWQAWSILEQPAREYRMKINNVDEVALNKAVIDAEEFLKKTPWPAATKK